MNLGSLGIAIGYYHLKRMFKNPYYLIWLLLVIASVYLISAYWLPRFPLNKEEWVLNCTSCGMLGAYLGLPFIVRSFSPAFAATGGVEFLGGRTTYLTYDIAINVIINVLILCLLGAVGMAITFYIVGKAALIAGLIYPILVIVLPAIMLLVTITIVLLVVLPTLAAVIIFWMLLLGLGVLPGLAPWGTIAMITRSSAALTPLMVANRCFYLIGAGLLIYIYSLLLKNQSAGVTSTRLQAKQAWMATSRAVIIAGQGLVLGPNLLRERIKKELAIIRYPRIIIYGLTAAGCGWLAKSYPDLGLASMGVSILFTAVVISPYTFEDYLIPEKQRKKWSFILFRACLALMLTLYQLLIFGLLSTMNLAVGILGALVMVGGWACLASHYWPLLTVRIMSSLFWIAVVFFPGALQMTNASHWWLTIGCSLMFLSLVLYRRHPYLE